MQLGVLQEHLNLIIFCHPWLPHFSLQIQLPEREKKEKEIISAFPNYVYEGYWEEIFPGTVVMWLRTW